MTSEFSMMWDKKLKYERLLQNLNQRRRWGEYNSSHYSSNSRARVTIFKAYNYIIGMTYQYKKKRYTLFEIRTFVSENTIKL